MKGVYFVARVSVQEQSPWWLEGGIEICFSCGQTYAREMERRCVHCDISLCSICATEHDTEVICCDCGKEESE